MSYDIILSIIAIIFIYLFVIKEVNLKNFNAWRPSPTLKKVIYGIITTALFALGYHLLTNDYSSGLKKVGLMAMFIPLGGFISYITYQKTKKIVKIEGIDGKIGFIVFILMIVFVLILGPIAIVFADEILNYLN